MTDRPITLSAAQFVALFIHAAGVPAPARADFLRVVFAELAGANPWPSDAAVERACKRALP